MKAMVVYDSVFGNTGKIGQAIGEGLGSPEEVEVRQVGDVLRPIRLAHETKQGHFMVLDQVSQHKVAAQLGTSIQWIRQYLA